MQAGRHTLRRSFLWLGSASALSRLVDLAAIVIVLRFVSASAVGAASAAWTITTLLEPFASLGVGYAILTMRRLDRRTIDAAVWLSLVGGLLFAGLVAAGAEFAGSLFGAPQVAPLIAIGGLKLIPVAVAAVPQQRLARALRHRELAAASTVATLLSAISRVVFATLGFEAWSFVLSQHVYAVTLAGCLWAMVPFKPRFNTYPRAVERLLTLGLPTSAGASVGLLARNLDMLFVSRWFGLEALGLYRVAFDLAVAPLVAIGDVIARSAAPTLRRLIRDPKGLSSTFEYSVKLATLVCLPIAGFVASLAPLLLTWAKDPTFVAAAPAARLLVLAGLLLVVFGLYGPLAQAIGNPELGLWSNLELFVLLATSLWVCLSLFGPFLSISAAAIAWCVALCTALLLTRHRFRRVLSQKRAKSRPPSLTESGERLSSAAYRRVI
ncbi:MAG: oligosaccharide flippase family protein [Myxococcales bacterium]